jgi:hypothetical protein
MHTSSEKTKVQVYLAPPSQIFFANPLGDASLQNASRQPMVPELHTTLHCPVWLFNVLIKLFIFINKYNINNKCFLLL